MAHIHLCWELGGGFGHAVRLKVLAQALLARGHQVTLSLRDLMRPHGLLAGLDVPMFQTPVWLHQAVGLPAAQANLAETLFNCGYLEPATLRGVLAGWRSLFAQLRPDLVVADYAPTAILAARSLGLRSAAVGNGFSSPPAGQPLPALRDWDRIPAGRLAASEARLLNTANTLLGEFGAAPFARAADLFSGDLQLLCTWPELDHYGRAPESVHWMGSNFLADAGIEPHWPPGDGPKVFAYLKASHPAHGAALRALVDEGCRTLVYMPEVAGAGGGAGGMEAPVNSPLLRYADGPVALQQALAQADLYVSHAGEATLAQSLLAGVQMLMLPAHTEQFLAARRVAASGAGLNAASFKSPAEWRDALRQLLDDPSYRQAAQAFAARHAGFSQQGMGEEVARLLERLLEEPAVR
jgi:UDP:flavonoid glycosyltransferase YjiC (YdhE family)